MDENKKLTINTKQCSQWVDKKIEKKMDRMGSRITESKGSVGETCVICEKKKEKGIHLFTEFICSDCEQEMVSTETKDEKYKYYINQLKKVTEPLLHRK
ncbi:sigma factor G inhibitor Gin [Calidifontibacillus erzurumensis]